MRSGLHSPGNGRPQKQNPPAGGGRMLSGWANHIEPTGGTRQVPLWPLSPVEASPVRQAEAAR
jgi:hypothetical protein